MSSNAAPKAVFKARHTRHMSADHYDSRQPHGKGNSWYLTTAAASAEPEQDTEYHGLSEFGEYLPSKTRKASFDSGYAESLDTSREYIRQLARGQASVPAPRHSSRAPGERPLEQHPTDTLSSSPPSGRSASRERPRPALVRANRPPPLKSFTELAVPVVQAHPSNVRVRPGRSRSNSETTGVRRTSRTMQYAIAGMSRDGTYASRKATSPLARSTFTEADVAYPPSFASSISAAESRGSSISTADSLASFFKPLPLAPEPPLTPPTPSYPSETPPKITWFHLHQPTRPSNIVYTQAPERSTSRSSLHRRALSNSHKSHAPEKELPPPPPDPLAHAKAIYRRSSLEYRFDIREILDALEEAHAVFDAQDVSRVKTVKGRFIEGVDTGLMLLNTIPDAVRTSASVRQAEDAVKTYKNLFSDFCSGLSPKLPAAQREERFCLAPRLLALLWTSLGELVTTCAVAIDAHEANPEAYAQLEEIEAAADGNEVKAVQSALATELRQRRNTGLKGLLTSVVQRVLPKTAVNIPAAVDGTQARVSWILQDEASSRGRARGSKGPDDMAIGTINLDPKSTKLVFDTITQHYLSRASDVPSLADNPEVRIDRNGRPVVMTLRALVDHIVDGFACTAEDPDVLATTDAFFLFLPCITNGSRVLNLLSARFFERPHAKIASDPHATMRWHARHALTRIQIIRLLTFWLENHFIMGADHALLPAIRDIRDAADADPRLPAETTAVLGVRLAECARGCPGRTYPRYPPALERTLKDGSKNAPVFADSDFSTTAERALASLEPDIVDVLFFGKAEGGVEELARAFTMIESDIFHSAVPYELYFHRDNRRSERFTIFDAASSWSNALCLWTVQSIVDKSTKQERANAYNVLAKVMNRCLEIRNYSSAYSILGGLLAAPITRLTSTMRLVNVTCKNMVKKADAYFHESGFSYSTYRADIASRVAPAVPLFNVIQGDVTKLYVRRRMTRDELDTLPDIGNAGRWVFLEHLKQLRKIVQDVEKCFVLYGVPTKPAVTSWLEASVRKLCGVSYDEYMSKLASQEVADEKLWLDRKV
ncbi:RasGEF domain-containing protein [Phanerochaete sordida]|uniref:RasGEF domain-containing protein n=1 Tax=Phanerochaete sordida TaxID=48140 RepID=A0A9P3GBZ6_9APHY|nr:RasGEF domain-containing protein [Phanerochaete sordida]